MRAAKGGSGKVYADRDGEDGSPGGARLRVRRLPGLIQRSAERDRPLRSTRRRGWLVRRVLLLADLCGLASAFGVTWLLFGSFSAPDAKHALGPSAEMLLLVLAIPVWVLLAKLYGLYDDDEERPGHATSNDLSGVFHVVTVGACAFAAGAWLTDLEELDFGQLVAFWVIAITLVSLARSVARALARRSSIYLQRTLIVGSDPVARLVAEKLCQRPHYEVQVVGFVDEPAPNAGSRTVLPLLGRPSELASIVSRLEIERVIIARLEIDTNERLSLVRSLRAQDVQIDVVPQPFEAVGPGGTVHVLEGVPIIGLSPIRLSRSSLLLKRTMDIVLSSVGLTLLAPVLALLALWVKLDSSGPALYRHERIGRAGRRFRLLKFRTMEARYCRGGDYGGDSAEEEFARLMHDASLRTEFESNYKLRSDPRVTKFGRFMRRTSLDELPQLVNVLRGELSLVGPRPVVAQELDRYGPELSTVLVLRPGLTGYWQVNGRSDCSYAERVRLDIAYASNWSLKLDLAILASTVRLFATGGRGGAY